MLIGMVLLDEIPSGNYGEKVNVRPLVAATLKLLGKAFDANFVLVPQLYGTYRDFPSLLKTAQNSDLGGRIHVTSDEYNSDEYQSLIGIFDLFVSFRLHSFIFAVRQGVPGICIGYEHKAFGFAESMNIQEYCLDLYNTTAKQIVKKATQVWEHRDEFNKEVKSNILLLEKLALKNSELAAELLASYKVRNRKYSQVT
jgi:colanic acid/amylovoran biosynthesis protein